MIRSRIMISSPKTKKKHFIIIFFLCFHHINNHRGFSFATLDRCIQILASFIRSATYQIHVLLLSGNFWNISAVIYANRTTQKRNSRLKWRKKKQTSWKISHISNSIRIPCAHSDLIGVHFNWHHIKRNKQTVLQLSIFLSLSHSLPLARSLGVKIACELLLNVNLIFCSSRDHQFGKLLSLLLLLLLLFLCYLAFKQSHSEYSFFSRYVIHVAYIRTIEQQKQTRVATIAAVTYTQLCHNGRWQ